MTAMDVDLTAAIVIAYTSNNRVQARDLPDLIVEIHAAVRGLRAPARPPEAETVSKPAPAQIRKSITHERLFSFEDGKPYMSLKRHLGRNGLTPATYRAKWGLPSDYPMVAPGYSERRSAIAHSFGLGRKEPNSTRKARG